MSLFIYTTMKKIWLLSLLICGLFLFGCQKQAESEIKVKEETTVELTAFDKSQLTEKEKNRILALGGDARWTYTYFLDVEYQIKSWDSYLMENYQQEPRETPYYLNSFNKEDVRIWEMNGNVLLTWYLESRMTPIWYYYETQEEMDAAPKVENWYIKYYTYWDINPKFINLWYKRDNIIPGREEFGQWEWDAIIAIGSHSQYFSFPWRVDSISHFHWYLSWEKYGINLHHFVNDGKVHTFRLSIHRPKFEWERSYATSVVKERDFLE